MSTKVINNNEIKDEDVTKLVFNLDPSDSSTVTDITEGGGYYLTFGSQETETFIDKHSIDNLILALQEAKNLWSKDNE